MFDITGSGAQKIYRIAFEAEPIRGPSEGSQGEGTGAELVTALQKALRE